MKELKTIDKKVNLKNKILTVIDKGLFLPLAIKCIGAFNEVRYYSPSNSPFPKKKDHMVGEGIEGLTVIPNLWDYVDDTDVFFFPDVHMASEQEYLAKLGKRVFGAKHGDALELDRVETAKLLKRIGIDTVIPEVVIGIDALEKCLSNPKYEGWYVKVSMNRGDVETFGNKSWNLTRPLFNEIKHELGIIGEDYEFLLYAPIDGDDVVEVGYDGYNICGVFPNKCLFGYEIKDLGYAGAIKDYKDISPLLKDYCDKLSPIFKEYDYRGFYSSEQRIRKKENKLTDLTCRAPSPPSELFIEMITNLPEIIWYGSEGKCIDLIPTAKFGIEVIITSNYAEKDFQAIYFPEKITQWVKLHNALKRDDTWYVIPTGEKEIGAVVAIGNTLDEAIEKVKDYCSQITGYCIDIRLDSINTVKEVMAKGEIYGIKV
jgi:hypothetical protein